MAISLKPLHEQVMVITGASSGIGLATALGAAKAGARVVLASRNQEALAKIEKEIKNEGGKAIYVVADVGTQEDVKRVADAAIKQFGGFDTWVNNAGVSIYGRLDEVSDEDHRKLFDTNFWGIVYGSLVAAKHLKTKGGAIINLGSEVSDIAIPLQGMYSASKHAVKGFTDAFRVELMEDKAPVSVTLIKPAGINTPYTEHAKNYTDRALTLPAPVYAPEEVANAILHAAETPYRDIPVGGGSKLMSSANKYMPGVMDWINSKFLSDQQLEEEPAHHHEGALHKPGRDGKVHGNHKGHVMKTSLYTRATLHPMVTGVIAAGLGAVALTLLNYSGSNGNGNFKHGNSRSSGNKKTKVH
jgi:short-subunit dehydrogenase